MQDQEIIKIIENLDIAAKKASAGEAPIKASAAKAADTNHVKAMAKIKEINDYLKSKTFGSEKPISSFKASYFTKNCSL